MSVRARDARKARALLAPLEAARVPASAFAGGAERRDALAPDIVLLDGEDPELEAWCAALRAGPAPPLRIVALLPLACDVERAAAADACAPLDASPVLLRRLIAEAVRAGVAAGELDRRRESAMAEGQSPPEAPKPAGAPLRLLHCGGPHRAFLQIERAAAERGAELSAALTMSAAFDRIHDQPTDGLILYPNEEPEAALTLCGALRRNAELHGMPTAVLSLDAALSRRAYDKGASLVCGVEVLANHGLGWLLRSACDRRAQRETERGLQALAQALFADTPAPVRAQRFLRHAERVCQAHREAERPLSLIALRFESAPGAAPAPGDWSQRCKEAADIAGRLIRAGDTCVFLEPDEVAILTPSRPEKAARTAADRLGDIIEHTAFVGAGGPLLAARAACELAPGESAAALIRRAFAAVKSNGARP